MTSLVFKKVLKAVLKLYPILLADPQPVADDCTNERWMSFEGCVGALDGTYIQCQPRRKDKPRFRTRKGDTVFNILGVCDPDMKFIHALSGEGSALIVVFFVIPLAVREGCESPEETIT